jgi:DNA-binding MarR family transcriptional regulator
MSSELSGFRPSAASVLAEFRGLTSEIDRMDQLAAERFGVNRTDLRALELLSAVGKVAPTALAAALGFTTGGATTVIDRLERAGYVCRKPDPHDRRKLLVETTPLLAAREAEIFGDLLKAMAALVSSYSEAELGTIGDFLARTRAVTAEFGGPSRQTA